MALSPNRNRSRLRAPGGNSPVALSINRVVLYTTGKTLVSASSLDKEIKEKLTYGGNKAAAKEVGILVAKRALDAGIKAVVFDRGGFVYHGKVQALAEAAREAGLKF